MNSNIEDIYPLSPMQEGIIFHTLYEPEAGIYFEQLSCALNGELNSRAFKQAWEQVVTRHAALRTAFMLSGKREALQVVHRQLPVKFREEDWRDCSGEEQRRRLNDLLLSERKRNFDLGKAPLMRFSLLRLGERTHQFVWCYHHVLMDGWSTSLVIRDFFEWYKNISRGQEMRLEPVLPYRSYIKWLKQQNLGEAEKYWRKALQGFNEPVILSSKKRDSNDQIGRNAEYRHQLSPELTQLVESFARRNQLTVNTIAQGAWAFILSRYSGREDIVFGATTSGRPAALGMGVESMVGLFINTLPVRVEAKGEAKVLEWLKRIQSQQTEARHYEYTPLVKVQEWSEVMRGMPLFESIVAFENYPVDEMLSKQEGLGFEIANVQTETRANYPLYAIVVLSSGMMWQINYDPNRFERGWVQRMAGHLERLLGEMVGKPEGRLSELEILGGEERRQLLEGWNDTQREYPRNRCIHELIEEQAERTPGAVAVVCGEKRLTYRELNEKSNQLAHYLRGLGVGPEVLVGICVERSLEMVVGLLGILKAGGAYVPLDPDYPKERLAFMLEDARVGFLLTEEKLAGGMLGYGGRCICLDRDRAGMEAASEGRSESRVLADNAAYVIYTSGSTGQPKGAVVTHYNLVRLLEATQPWFEFGGQDVWTFFHSHAFDFSVWEIWGALVYGGKVVVVPYLVSRAPEEFYKLLIREGVTVLNQTPSAFAQLIRAGESLGWEGGLALRYVIFGGEALEMRSLKPWFERHGEQRPQLVNMYGITETTVHVTYRPVGGGDVSGGSVIGVPIPDLAVYLLDSRGELAPMGAQGELYVGGKGVARGYLTGRS